MTREMRQAIVQELRIDGQSTRQIAQTLGVDAKTVRNDLKVPGGELSPPGATPPDEGLPAHPADIPRVTGLDGKSYPASQPVKPPEPEAPTRPIPTTPPRKPKEPKPGRVIFNWPAFYANFRGLVNALDNLYKSHGLTDRFGNLKEDAAHHGLNRLLIEFVDGLKTRYQEITKMKPPEH
jgi:hypothetical protein